MRTVLIVTLLAFANVQAYAQSDKDVDKETLRGLPGVYVVTDITDNSTLERDGLTSSQIQTDVELRLRKAGIRVFSLEEVKKLPSRATLFVQIMASRNEALSKQFEESIYSFSIQINLKQTASLLGSPSRVFLVTTWSGSAVGTTTKRNLKLIRESIGDYIDKFSNDYLAMNPK